MNKLSKFVNVFEKLTKLANEDSGMITMLVRPVANQIINSDGPTLLNKFVVPILQRKGGEVKIGGIFLTTAGKDANGDWVVDAQRSKLNAVGSGDQEVDAALAKVVAALNKKISLAVQNELNRASATLAQDYDVITDHESYVNELPVSVELE